MGIVVFLASFTEASASAQETTHLGDVTVSATLHAPEGSSCPSEKKLLDAIRRSLSHAPSDEGPASVEVVIAVDAKGNVGSVRTIGRDADKTIGKRTTRAKSCVHLAEALVLIVVQTLDPLADESTSATIDGDDTDAERGSTETPAADDDRKSPATPSPSPRSGRRARHPQAQPLPSSRRVVFGAMAGASVATGIFPSLTPGAYFGLWLGTARSNGVEADLRGSQRLEASTTILFPSTLDLGEGSFQFRGVRPQLSGCPTSFGTNATQASPCLSLGALWVDASARDFAQNTGTLSVVPYVGLGAMVRVHLTDTIGLRLAVDASAFLRRAEWVLRPVGVVHELAPVSFGGTVAVESLRP
ncbi:hypothetical protein AKJ09_07008 [Labilithrix luteola]|uniref:Uncharacterized protein n=1 Tax=Labilithrix luteola TaxID=1391654 RepID=A0A0K1Q4N0_9BACT|nr:hypothetical protein [Labilithrix luteola]AKV00345.1 hypothetical protein AKJ09_07008 [Labilithrix luteola]